MNEANNSTVGIELPDVVRSVGYGIALIALPWILATVLMRSSSSEGMSLKSLLALLVVGGGGFVGFKLYQGDWMMPAAIPMFGERSAAFSFERDASVIGGAPLTRESLPAFERLILREFSSGSASDSFVASQPVQVRLLTGEGVTLLHASNARYGSLLGEYYAGLLGNDLHLVFCVAGTHEQDAHDDPACREEIEQILGSPLAADSLVIGE